MGKADGFLANDYKLTGQFFCVALQQSFDRLYLDDCPFIIKTQQNDAFVRTLFSIYFLTEILVIRHENPILSKCFPDYVIIIHATGFIINRKYFVSLLAQPFGYGRTSGLVHKKPHLRFFPCEGHEGSIL